MPRATARGKLNTGLGWELSLRQGAHYFVDSFNLDPIRLGLTLSGMLLAPGSREASLAVEIALYPRYVRRIGGDFIRDKSAWLMGHFPREASRGYLETLRSGRKPLDVDRRQRTARATAKAQLRVELAAGPATELKRPHRDDYPEALLT
jgi:hypothetical protein